MNGIARAGIAALDVASGAVLPWNANLDLPSVFKVFADGAVIYIHGNFTSAGGVLRAGTAALDSATGAALPFGSGSAEAASGDRLYSVCINPGNLRFSVCAYDRAGVPLPTWVIPLLGVSEYSVAVAADASHVFVLTFDGANVTRVRRYDPITGAAQSSWTPPTFTENAWAMTLANGTLYLGGTFTSVNGQPRNGLAALDAATGALTSWAPAIGGSVRMIAVAQGRVAVGGGFASAGGIARRHLAALDLTTGLPVNVAPAAARPVTALVASGDLVVAADSDEIFGFSAATGERYPVTLPYSGHITALEI